MRCELRGRLCGLSGRRVRGAGMRPAGSGLTGRNALFQKEDAVKALTQGNKVAQQNTMDGAMAREQAHRKKVIGNKAEKAVLGREKVKGGTVMTQPDPLALVKLPKYSGAVAQAKNRNNIKIV